MGRPPMLERLESSSIAGPSSFPLYFLPGPLAESLQVAFDSGAKRILLPTASVKDIPTIPGELFAKFQTTFYADPTDAVFKALGVQ